MTQYLLRPLDTQFHRTGLPFDAAQDVETESLFPPSPRTVYGALRAWGFIHCDETLGGEGPTPSDQEIKDVFGDKSSPGSLRLKGPVIFRVEQNLDGRETFIPLLPPPLDLVKDKESGSVCLLRPDPNERPLWNLPNWLAPVQTGFDKNVLESLDHRLFMGWPDNMVAYLTGNIDEERFYQNAVIDTDDAFRREWHLGISRSRQTKSVVPGYLYLAGHFRMVEEFFDSEHVLWIETNDDIGLLPKKGVLRLGGESRQAAIARLESDTPWYGSVELKHAVIDVLAESGRFKLVLISPAAFGRDAGECTSLPDAIDRATQRLCLECGDAGQSYADLVGVCLPRPNPIGGWDIARRREKSMQACVPAGSVYFFQFSDWDKVSDKNAIAAKLVETFHGTTALQSGVAAKEGFGLSLVGGW